MRSAWIEIDLQNLRQEYAASRSMRSAWIEIAHQKGRPEERP